MHDWSDRLASSRRYRFRYFWLDKAQIEPQTSHTSIVSKEWLCRFPCYPRPASYGIVCMLCGASCVCMHASVCTCVCVCLCVCVCVCVLWTWPVLDPISFRRRSIVKGTYLVKCHNPGHVVDVYTTLRLHGNYIETTLDGFIHENYMETTWKLHGNYMETTLKLHENYMETTWNYMKTTWKLHGNYMETTWKRLVETLGGNAWWKRLVDGDTHLQYPPPP